MATSKRIPRSVPPISMAVQNLHVTHRFPGFACKRIGAETIWRGSLQPREVSPVYLIEVKYKLGRWPRVRVLQPTLVPRAPHVYADETLCLYWPDEWIWRGHELVAETVIPWTALWLYYYELWLDTGEWLGPSSHHPSPKDQNEVVHDA